LTDEGELEKVGGLEFLFEGTDVAVVFVDVFAGQDGLLGEEPVLEGVLGDALFAGLGARAGGVLGVLSVGLELFV
jgi:hypothetical protein